jgi:hypothetical protein
MKIKIKQKIKKIFLKNQAKAYYKIIVNKNLSHLQDLKFNLKI